MSVKIENDAESTMDSTVELNQANNFGHRSICDTPERLNPSVGYNKFEQTQTIDMNTTEDRT